MSCWPRSKPRTSNSQWFFNLVKQQAEDDDIYEYDFSDIGHLREGVSFEILGYVLLDCERFIINFSNEESGDIMLHISPRIPQNYVIRTCRIKNQWNKIEASSALPFVLRRGKYFSLEVLVTEECYMISINGHHFAEFKHRLPYKKVNFIEIKGDVQNVVLKRRMVKAYPMRTDQYKRIRVETSFTRGDLDTASFDDMRMDHIPQDFKRIRKITTAERATRHTINVVYRLPYYGRLEPSLADGSCLKIVGRVRVLPHSFSINLQNGYYTWPRPNVAFYFSPRYLEKVKGSTYQQVVVSNSYSDGNWSDEIRVDIYDEFAPGRTFSLAIICTKECYEVYINRKWLLDFKHRLPPDTVNMLYIEGDIKIWDIVLDTNEWTSEKRKMFKHPEFAET